MEIKGWNKFNEDKNKKIKKEEEVFEKNQNSDEVEKFLSKAPKGFLLSIINNKIDIKKLAKEELRKRGWIKK